MTSRREERLESDGRDDDPDKLAQRWAELLELRALVREAESAQIVWAGAAYHSFTVH
jgi:hypothetical protein